MPHDLKLMQNFLERCEESFKKAKIPEEHIESKEARAKMDKAKGVLKEVESLSSSPRRCVPAGQNNVGKTYFINSLALGERIESLQREAGEPFSQKELESLPLRSDSLGNQASTIYSTVLRHSAGGFHAFFEVWNETDFAQVTQFLDPEKVPVWGDLHVQLVNYVKSTYFNSWRTPLRELTFP